MDSDKFLFNLQHIYNKNKKIINYILVAILALIGAWYYYFEIYKQPRETAADASMFMAQKYFQSDSFDLALNGSGANKGFLYVTKNYTGTKAANLAYYYLGVIYLHKKEYRKSIEMIEKFSTKSNLLNGYAKVILADAKSELKEYDKAIALYIEAATILANDNVMGAQALLKSGMLLEIQNKTDEAIKTYKRLITSFPLSNQRAEAQRYIIKLGSSL